MASMATTSDEQFFDRFEEDVVRRFSGQKPILFLISVRLADGSVQDLDLPGNMEDTILGAMICQKLMSLKATAYGIGFCMQHPGSAAEAAILSGGDRRLGGIVADAQDGASRSLAIGMHSVSLGAPEIVLMTFASRASHRSSKCRVLSRHRHGLHVGDEQPFPPGFQNKFENLWDRVPPPTFVPTVEIGNPSRTRLPGLGDEGSTRFRL